MRVPTRQVGNKKGVRSWSCPLQNRLSWGHFTRFWGQNNYPQWSGTRPVKQRRLGSAGRETTGARVRVVDEDDRDLPADEHGEIVVCGDLVMQGYWNNPEATAATVRHGWHHTGDVGFLDADGYLYITDRKKDMIISGGANIYPREIEEVICTHPAVLEVSVVGVPDETWGESVKALVVPRPGMTVTEAGIFAHCRRGLG